jgi:glyceraldehyde 3-phosphate dehydrogenase
MAITVAINGFGRIGRLVFRHAYKDPRFNIVAVNDHHQPRRPRAPAQVRLGARTISRRGVRQLANGFSVDGKTSRFIAEKGPGQASVVETGRGVGVESTGLFTKRPDAEKHLAAGARRVLISAPATDPTSPS